MKSLTEARLKLAEPDEIRRRLTTLTNSMDKNKANPMLFKFADKFRQRLQASSSTQDVRKLN